MSSRGRHTKLARRARWRRGAFKVRLASITITAEAFHADPARAYQEAGRADRVIVTDSSGAPRLVIYRQREAMRSTRSTSMTWSHE